MSEPTTKTVTVSTIGEAMDLYLESNREVIELRRKVEIAEKALLLARSVCHHPGTSFDREKVFNICDHALDAMKGGG